jgi:hypothetical protein
VTREIIEPSSLDEAVGLPLAGPVRFTFSSPLRGGPALGDIRRALASRGRLRFSGSRARLFVDVDPGEPESPVVALDMIVRSDALGLERALLSALPLVDELVIGVDARSDPETAVVAQAFADTVYTFYAGDIGLTEEEWKDNRIHFSNARNFGREKVKAPWTLVIDSDEYIERADDLRKLARDAGVVDAYGGLVKLEGFTQYDRQRFALTSCRWRSGTHNVLPFKRPTSTETRLVIVHDNKLRAAGETARRDEQRTAGVVADLTEEARKGNLNALFHLAKHLLVYDIAEGVKLAQEFRLKAEPHGLLMYERTWLAFSAAWNLYETDSFDEVELWCIRALHDGPYIEALCLLGDVAEDQGDIERAWRWYELACAAPPANKIAITWPVFTDLRWGRRDGLRVALGLPPKGKEEPAAEGDQAQTEHHAVADGGGRSADGGQDVGVVGAGEG